MKFDGKKWAAMARAIAVGVVLGGVLIGIRQARHPGLTSDAASNARRWLQTGGLPVDGNTVAIYRNVSVADMLQELEVIHTILKADASAESLAASVDALIEELRLSFQDDLSHSYHRLSSERRETYNEVALLIVDLRLLIFTMARRDKEAARAVNARA